MAYDISRLEQALIKADAAGDTEAAKSLAAEIRNIRSQSQSGGKQTGSPLGRKEDTLQIFNPFGKNLDTGIPIGSSGSDFLAGVGKSFADTGRGIGQMIGAVDTKDVDESRKIDSALMNTTAGKLGSFSGSLAQFLPTAFIPGANTATGAALTGSAMGLLGPVGTGESRTKNAMIGGALGLGGRAIGLGAGKVVSSAANKVKSIEAKVAAKAAADAASETASARSAAGNAAQNAYKQLEHLRELKALRGLTGEEAQVAKELEKELADKALEKLIPAAALKKSTSEAYREAIATESGRAAKMAAEKLSGKEVKNQLMARLKRYGPMAAGGVLAGNFLFPGLGGAVGGAATGLVLRPAIRSMINLTKNPAVQHKMLSPIAKAGLLSDVVNPQALGLLAPLIYTSQQ